MADIPNTTAGATKSTKKSIREGLWAISIHASSGHDSIGAMVEQRGESRIWAVTLLTSITREQCVELFGAPPEVIVPRWAGIALRQGVQGIHCSPEEITLLRREYGNDFELANSGVRTPGSQKDDQSRIDTPYSAITNGATYLVIGRPITAAQDPIVAAEKIASEIDQALQRQKFL